MNFFGPASARSYKIGVVGNNWLVVKAVFSETALRIFLIFCMKLRDYKGRNVTSCRKVTSWKKGDIMHQIHRRTNYTRANPPKHRNSRWRWSKHHSKIHCDLGWKNASKGVPAYTFYALIFSVITFTVVLSKSEIVYSLTYILFRAIFASY